ncbi:hypothetical protein [Marinomonas ostreistagni]|uniref:hypothetical protein n=1 Tax=Marinomonas ostreistagni TaxID=359209 RepID=UPI00194E95A8|nr:hypothetical protein [Marinomonas ostreistagni]MBM6549898.1 hypothetical protein [Marinomonas ostreistagni]
MRIFNSTPLKASSLLLSALLLQGCLPGNVQKSPQQIEQQNELRAMLIERMNQRMNTAPAAPEVNKDFQTDQLTKRKAPYEGVVIVTEQSDGFKLNGHRVVDPEGQVFGYGVNSTTGEFIYLVKTGSQHFSLKYGVLGDSDRVTVAKGVYQRGSISISTYDGQNLSGNNLIPTADGFIIDRGDVVFKYNIFDGQVANLSIPEGFMIAPLQKGDIASTGLVLLEKVQVEPSNAAAGAVDAIKGIFSIAKEVVGGDSEAFDYTLFNTRTGETTRLNISASGKKVGDYSGCQSVNFAVNKCSQVNFRESLYDKYGRPNTSHYYWLVDWFTLHDGGVVAVARENSLSELNVYDLKSKQKFTAFERGLGISSHRVTRHQDGHYSVEASLGFSTKELEDLDAYLAQKSSQ